MKCLILILISISSLQANTPGWANSQDLHVARVISGECRGESKAGQRLVADVIHTRMLLRGLTSYEVVTQRKQFLGYSEDPVSKYIWELTYMLKTGIDPIKTAKFDQFRAYAKSPLPAWGRNPYYIGGHVFFQE